MATQQQKVFLIKTDHNRECVMRLPVNTYGGITTKGFKIVRDRFYDAATDTRHTTRYALCLEAYSSADDLIRALGDYKKNKI